MKVLILSIILFGTNTVDASAPERFDIVQIDTGTTIAIKDTVVMDKTCDNCWNIHGTAMAISLNSQARALKMARISAKQVIWGQVFSVPESIYRAVSMNPKIISMSLAGKQFSEVEFRAAKKATDSGILVLAAAGNNGWVTPEFPAAYKLDCMVAVSTQEFGKKVQAASGGEMYLPRVGKESGTSYSTARAGAIALDIERRHPSWSCQQVKAELLQRFSLPGKPQNNVYVQRSKG